MILMADIETTEKETCKGCGNEIGEGDDIITIEDGVMEYLDDGDGTLFSMNQGSVNRGQWHKACFPGKILESE